MKNVPFILQKKLNRLFGQPQKRKKKTIPFTMATERIKYLRLNLTKEVKDLYTENCKALMKGIEENK